MLMSPVAATIYLPLLPLLSTHFSVSSQAINLTITAYIICQAISPLLLASISDHFGRRPVYVVASALFTVSSLGLALNKSSYAALLVLRGLQSIGASCVLSVCYGTISDICVPAQRGKMLGPMMVAGNAGTSIGPVVGGWIAQASKSYQWIFWSLTIFGALILVLLIMLLPETARNVVGNGDIDDETWNQPLWKLLRRHEKRIQTVPSEAATTAGEKVAGDSMIRIPYIGRSFQIQSPLAVGKILLHKDTSLIILISSSYYALWYCVQATIPMTYSSPPHNFTELQVGLAYLPGAAGIVLSAFLSSKFLDWNYNRTARKAGVTVDKSFGYDANWDKESILNIHDFAKDLLSWLKDSPSLPRGECAQIVFVCHSLGGLVAKRAYILSQQLEEFQAIGDRICSIFFLATPHRGSNMAELLSRILQVSSTGSRPFVADLHPNSVSIQAINDEFPRYSKSLLLYSYYETNAMNFGVKKAIIVPKDSAVLGYPNEQSSFLSNANHREVCKFLRDREPNYLAVRNGIASVIETIRTREQHGPGESDVTQHTWLKEHLLIDETYTDDYQRIDTDRVPGTCEWILESAAFRSWKDSPSPQLLWLTAKPGTGKSIALGYVINHLQSIHQPCAFYFFTYGDKFKFSISLFLRSIAWQLASIDRDVFEIVLNQCQKDAHLVQADHRTIWRKLFLEGIFKVTSSKRFYLAIDALDECLNNTELIMLLIKCAATNILRVFLTSRNTFDTYGMAHPPNLDILSEKIPQSRTASDIALYITANLHNLPALGPDKTAARKAIVKTIVEKSSGCFLWVHLVLSELRNVHTSEEVRQVLEEIPGDMDQLYSYILSSMSELKRGKPLTKAILAWTVCAVRPLTTLELHAALELDMDDTVDDMERSIATTCGQLVFVDSNSKVQILHQTAREFLLSPTNESEFAIARKEANKRLAMVCLKYLCSDEMSTTRPRKLSSTTATFPKSRSNFRGYASSALADHIATVSSQDNDFFLSLSRFFRSDNLLSWVEYVAKESDLKRLIFTGQALKRYVQRRSKHVVPIGKDIALLTEWSMDLVRLVTSFGTNLLKSPSSIHQLIPPFCPPESALRRQFGTTRRSIVVSGLRQTTWDDCSSVIRYQQESPTALAYSSTLFAIAQRSGKIRIHDETTCQEIRMFSHGQAVRLVRFGLNGILLASVASKSVCIWNVKTWVREWLFEVDSICIDISFVDNDLLLLAVTMDNRILLWDLASGSLETLDSWVDELDEGFVSGCPTTATIGAGSSMLAIAYRGHDIIVWDIESEKIHDIYGQDVGSLGPNAEKRSGVASVISLLFSPVVESPLLAAGYNNGELVVFDTADHRVLARAQANAHSFVSSPDGMLLACSNSAGMIMIYDFESLKIVYRIVSEEYSIKSLVFSANSQRLIDIRGPFCRVWDPPALLRDEMDTSNSDTISISTSPQDYVLLDSEPAVPISAFVCCDENNSVICGNVDGSICLFDGVAGRRQQELIRSNCDSSITYLCYDAASRLLTSADIDSTIVSYKLSWDRKLCRADKIFQHRESTAVSQLLSNRGSTRLLISTTTTDTLCTRSVDGFSTKMKRVLPNRHSHKWCSHPTDESQLILFEESTAHLFSWDTLERLTPPIGIQLTVSILPELIISSVTSCFDGQVLATTFTESLASGSKARLFLWPTTSFTTESLSSSPVPHYQPLAGSVESLIGAYNQRLIFLHQDGWVCSADPHTVSSEGYCRHFFFPNDWLSTSGMGRLMLGILSNTGNVVFIQGDEVAVVRKGLDVSDGGSSRSKKSSTSGPGRNTSLVHRSL
ncbi:hypothetical protein VTL71DRAFT_16262 [Oculimacula yallundae]|uniref:Major facilitator superfamily (MFS) profile domain-containing protein n=1 Tax=Oculimacula yallundae TaxID=86028 RepID=A0ABR4CG75_9HELO